MTDETRTDVEREERIVDAFLHLADTLVDRYDVIEYLYTLTQRCVDLTECAECAIMLASPAGRLHAVTASNERSHLLELFELQNDNGPCLDAFRTGEVVSGADLSGDEDQARWPTFAPHAASVGFRSVHSVPLRLRSDTVGALNLLSNNPGDLSEIDARLVAALAKMATIGIQHQRALARAEEKSAGLQEALTSRIRIEQAKGVIAERANVSIDDAFELLRGHARSHNLALTAVAQAVVAGTLDLTPRHLAGGAGG